MGTKVLLCLAFLVGCVATLPQPSPVTALLVVENQRTDDEWIYLERSGGRGRKLGRVTALSTDTLVLRDADAVPGQDLEFIAIAFASGAADRSEGISMVRGAVYHWQLAPSRGMAFLSRAE